MSKIRLSHLKSVFLIMLAFAALFAYAEEPNSDLIQKILSVASPLPEEKIFYRWGNAKTSDKLIKAGKVDDEIYKYFQSPKADGAAGRGIYVSGNPFSSAEYATAIDGGGVEVHVAKGSLFLDLTNENVVRKLYALGIELDHLHHLPDVPLVIRYTEDSDWWVVRGKSGVSFTKLKSETLSVRQMNEYYRKIGNSSARKLFSEGSAPRILKELKSDPSLIRFEAVGVLFPDEEVTRRLEKVIPTLVSQKQGFDDIMLLCDSRPLWYASLDGFSKTTILKNLEAYRDPENVRIGLRLLSLGPRTDVERYIQNILTDPASSEETKVLALRFLFEKPGNGAGSQRLLELVKSLGAHPSTGELGQRAMLSYAKMAQNVQVKEAFSRWLNHPIANVRENAIKSLFAMPHDKASKLLDPKIMNDLITIIRGPDESLAQAVLAGWNPMDIEFSRHESESLFVTTVEDLLKDPNPNLRARVIDFIADGIKTTDPQRTTRRLFDWAQLSHAIDGSSRKQAQRALLSVYLPDKFSLHADDDLTQIWESIPVDKREKLSRGLYASSRKMPDEQKRKWLIAFYERVKKNGSAEPGYFDFFTIVHADPNAGAGLDYRALVFHPDVKISEMAFTLGVPTLNSVFDLNTESGRVALLDTLRSAKSGTFLQDQIIEYIKTATKNNIALERAMIHGLFSGGEADLKRVALQMLKNSDDETIRLFRKEVFHTLLAERPSLRLAAEGIFELGYEGIKWPSAQRRLFLQAVESGNFDLLFSNPQIFEGLDEASRLKVIESFKLRFLLHSEQKAFDEGMAAHAAEMKKLAAQMPPSKSCHFEKDSMVFLGKLVLTGTAAAAGAYGAMKYLEYHSETKK